MEEFLLGFGILLSIFVWKAWKRTALDACRDDLFDIRDGVRTYFVSRNLPLDSKLYVSLRDLLNAHIRYTKKMTFPRFLSMTIAMSANSEIMLQMKAEIESRLKTDDEELAAYVASVRKNSSEAMIKFVGETSAFIIFVVVFAWPFSVIAKIAKTIWIAVRDQNRVMVDGFGTTCAVALHVVRVLFKAIPLALVSLIMAFPARAGVIDKKMTSASMLEEYSYESSLLR